MSSEAKSGRVCAPDIDEKRKLLAKYDEMIEEGSLVSKAVLRAVKKDAEKIRKELEARRERDLFMTAGDSTYSACSIQ